jgi:hypothetical protein
MADTESPRPIAQVRAPFSAWLAVILLFVLFGAIVWVVIGPSRRGTDYEEKRAKIRIEKLKALREENAKDLNSYAWVNKAKGVVRIPIERAMELTVAELQQKTPTMAGPIATPMPSPQPSAAASASPGKTAPAPAASASPRPAAPKPPGAAPPMPGKSPAGA